MRVELHEGAIVDSRWHGRWGAVYGNLMLCVALFFLALSISKKDLPASQTGSKGDRSTFSSFGVDEIAKLDVKENRMRIIFGDPVIFASGSANFKPTAMPYLQRLADGLMQLPNPIQIEGHTDDQPPHPSSGFRSNWELSAARAFAVLRYLEKAGVPSRRLSAIGYGEFKPVAPNESPEQRALNRRIEIVIVRQEN